MTDVVSPAVRSRMMAGIRGKNTKPEWTIRRALFARGFRFRVHVSNLSGKPDLVFPKLNALIFVHGCFWHLHECALFKWPSSNVTFWRVKLLKNRQVDSRSMRELRRDGWRVLTVWECALKGPGRRSIITVIDQIEGWLHSKSRVRDIRGKI